MSGVDNRIVTMKFDNRDFEKNAQTSLTTLGKLKESMNFGSIVGGTVRGLGTITSALSKIGLHTPFNPMIKAANTGLAGIGTVLDKLGMKNPFTSGVQGAADLQTAAARAGGPAGMGILEGGVTAVSGRFVALTTIAVTALSRITNQAITAGTNLTKSLTISPIKAGFDEYELKMDSIQTILANTAKYGTKLPQVTKSLNELNHYADKTIYNFGDMTKNIGLFTNSGLRVEEATSIIKGFSNSAAASGTSAQGAASAAYQLSQAMSAGTVRLMDWRSLTNVGMGNQNMKDGIIEIADAMGTLDKAGISSTDIQKDFNGSLEKNWLSADVMSKYLQIMAGDLTVAQQKQLGLTDAQIDNFTKTQKTAEDAATKVRTLSKLISTLQEAVGSTWSSTFDMIFGDFNEATKLFTHVNNVVGGMLSAAGKRRNDLIKGWDKLGGRDVLIEALGNAFTALMEILRPIGDAFRDIFPAQTAKSLMSMTEGFAALTEKMKPSEETVKNLRSAFGGFFAIFSIAGQIISGVIGMFKDLFTTVGGGGGGFLSFAGSVGEALKSFDAFLEKSGVLESFFSGLAGILSVPLALLKGIGSIIAGLFSGFDSGAASQVGDAVDGIGNRLSGLEAVGQRIADWFGKIGSLFGKIGQVIGNALVGVGDLVAGAFTPETFGRTLDVINTTLLGGLVLLIRNFFNKGVNIDLTGGLFDGIKQTLGEATGAFENMQNSLKADILLKLAGAIGVMALSLLVLSSIDPGALAKALGAMTGGFAILIGAMATLMKVMGPAGLVQLYVTTSALTKMSFSILLLALALKTLASVNFGDMLRGLFGLAAMMKILTKALLPMAAGSKGMAKAATSLILVGVALNILAVALKIMASMSWEEMAKGLVGLAGTLVILSGALRIMPDMKAEGIGLVLLAASMVVLATALKLFATMSWEEMAKGLIMLAGSLLIIAAAINLMPKTMMLQAAALVAVAGAMTILAGALKIMGSMGWEEIAKGLVAMAGAMIILAAGLQAIGIVGTIGAVGLLAAAAAMAVMLPVMVAFGAMDWMTILKSLTMLAGIFVILGVAGYALAPVTPVLMGLGVAVLLLGAGLALAGAAALAFATAFGIVVAAGSAGAQIVIGFMESIIKTIPQAVGAFGKGIIQFAVAIGQGAPKIAKAFGKLLSNILDSVIKNVPKMGRAFMAMLNTALNVISKMSPKIFNAGLDLIVGFLRAINSHISQITSLAASIIVKFINGIANNLSKIIQAGVNLIIKFIEGVAKAVRNNGDKLGRAGADLGLALIEGTADAIRTSAGLIKDAAMDAARDAWEAAKDFFKIGGPSKLMCDTVGKPIVQGWAGGIRSDAPLVGKELETVGNHAIGKVSSIMKGVDDAFKLDPNLNPTVTPVLDLGQLTKEANKMSSILATAPIMPTVSYQAAADISTVTQASQQGDPNDGPDGPSEGGGGDTYVTYEQHLHSPTPLDSVTIYRDGKSLIAMKKEELAP